MAGWSHNIDTTRGIFVGKLKNKYYDKNKIIQNVSENSLYEETAQISQSCIAKEDDSQSESLLHVISELKNTTSSLNELRKSFEERLSYDATKEKSFDALYAELEKHKKNATLDALRPLYIDIILLFDRIDSVRKEIPEFLSKKSFYEDFLKTLSEEILEILYRQGIEMTESPLTFDPKFQRAIGIKIVLDPKEDNKIDRVIRRGFKYRNICLRPEEVIVKKLK